jgi:lysophospholipase L1-like esterase
MYLRLFSLAIISSLLLPFSTHASSLLLPAVINIAPYGNSITQAASNQQSYRYPLWKKLVDANISFDFVGTMNTNNGGNPTRADYKGKKFDPDHEGHWGWRADEILNSMGTWLTKYTPDMVLFHIGSNDCIQNQDLNSTVNELTQIVTKLRNDNKNVIIFMATLIPCNASTQATTNVNNLNAKIKTLVTQLNTEASPVILVDQNSGITSSDLYDGVHPGPTGEEKMAQKWFDAINKFITTPAQPVKESISTSAVRLTPAHQSIVKFSGTPEQQRIALQNKQTTTNILGKKTFESAQDNNSASNVLIVRNKK